VSTVRLAGALATVLLLVLLGSGGASAREDALAGTIVFNGGDLTSSDIFTVRADGSHLRQLTRTKAWEQQPSWSPDGKSIVYVLAEGEGGGALYRMSATGRNKRLFLREDASAHGYIADPEWSPDGKRVSFSSQRLGDLRVWTIGVDGTLTMVTKTFGTHATWSSDGRRLAYAGLADTGRSAIFVIGADGRGRRQVTQPDVADQQPVWSPDGKWIAFESLNPDWRRHQVDSLEIVRPDGTGRRRVLRGNGVISPMAWSPRSDRILFRRGAGGQSTVPAQLFTVGLHGGLATPVAGTYGAGGASWHR
jgi:Tol biopolymer transport system component